MITVTEIGTAYQPTRGEVAFEKAKNLARFAAERAMTKDWEEHPMFGICVDPDKWAMEYQRELRELAAILTPNASTGGRNAKNINGSEE